MRTTNLAYILGEKKRESELFPNVRVLVAKLRCAELHVATPSIRISDGLGEGMPIMATPCIAGCLMAPSASTRT